MSDGSEQNVGERLASAATWASEQIVALQALNLLSQLHQLGLHDEVMGPQLRENPATQAALNHLVNLAIVSAGYSEPTTETRPAGRDRQDVGEPSPAAEAAASPSSEDDVEIKTAQETVNVGLHGNGEVSISGQRVTLSEAAYQLLTTLLHSDQPLKRFELAPDLMQNAFSNAKIELNTAFREAIGEDAIVTTGRSSATRYLINPGLALAADEAADAKKN